MCNYIRITNIRVLNIVGYFMVVPTSFGHFLISYSGNRYIFSTWLSSTVLYERYCTAVTFSSYQYCLLVLCTSYVLSTRTGPVSPYYSP